MTSMHRERLQRERIARLEAENADLQRRIAALQTGEPAPRQLLDEILRHSGDILYRRDLRTNRYVYLSHAFGQQLGYTPQETERLAYHGVEECIHPADRERHAAFLRQLIDDDAGDRSPAAIEYRMRCKDGAWRWFNDRIAIVRDVDGTARFALGSNRDITSQKTAQLALINVHEQFLTVLDSIDATIYVADMQTHEILFMNRYMRDAFGGDLIGHICHEVFRGLDAPCPHCTNPTLLDASGKPTGVQMWEDRNPITGRWYVNYDRAIKWVDERWVRLQIATDITKIKQLEEERRKSEGHLRRVERLEAIGTLAGGVAHDFNNLLMGMLGNVSLMQMDTDASHPHAEKLAAIERQIHSASRLTGQLLGYASRKAYDLLTADVNTLLGSILETFGRTRRQLRIQRSFADDLPPVRIDETRLEQVVWNLLINAADAMPGGGTLSLVTRPYCRDKAGDDHHVPAGSPASGPASGGVCLEIADTGIGMTREVQERIFEPFFTTKEMGHGTGLGLASVYGIVEGHHGHIDVQSTPGRGTTFTVFLPASDGELLPPDRLNSRVTAAEGIVLLVDDEPMVREVATQMLDHMGYTVLTADNGHTALDLVEERGGNIALAILDLIMPEMGGAEAFDRLRERYPDIRVLLISGYPDNDDVRAILDRGCNGFIQKPFSLEQLSAKMAEVLDASQPAPERHAGRTVA